MSHNAVNLKSNFMELTELKHVLEKTDAFFQEVSKILLLFYLCIFLMICDYDSQIEVICLYLFLMCKYIIFVNI